MRAYRHFPNQPSHWKPPPEMMSCDEIRWWLTALRQRYGWGTRVLGRTMGLRNEAAVGAKASGKAWIYGSEQVRMSRQLKRIISGELVPIPGRRGRGHAGKAVLVAHPTPLRLPTRMRYDMTCRRVRFEPMELPAPALPSFKTLLDNPPKWRKLGDG